MPSLPIELLACFLLRGEEARIFQHEYDHLDVPWTNSWLSVVNKGSNINQLMLVYNVLLFQINKNQHKSRHINTTNWKKWIHININRPADHQGVPWDLSIETPWKNPLSLLVELHTRWREWRSTFQPPASRSPIHTWAGQGMDKHSKWCWFHHI